jgi:hypothetical protein
MHAQLFAHQTNHTRYSDLLLHMKGADNLPFLTSAAVMPYLRQLNDRVPDIADNLGHQFLLFRNFRFEIIQSDIRDKGRHRVAISFITEPMTWHHTIGTYLLLSHLSAEPADGAVPAHLLQLQPFLSIDTMKNA